MNIEFFKDKIGYKNYIIIIKVKQITNLISIYSKEQWEF
jgi:hypothetical protein